MKIYSFKRFKNLDLQTLSVFFTVLVYFYFWDIDYSTKFDPLYVIILPILIYFLNFRKNEVIANFNYFLENKIYIYYLIPILIILIFFFYRFEFNFEIIPKHKLIKIIGFFLLIIFSTLFFKSIVKQIKYLVIIFSSIYFFVNLIDYFIYFQNYSFNEILNITNLKCSYQLGPFRSNYIFSENSHFGMISVSLNIYLIYLISKGHNYRINLYYFLICLSFIGNSSTTYLVGYILSYLAILIACNKNLNFKFYIVASIFLILCITPLIFDRSCSKRITDISTVNAAISDISKNSNISVKDNIIFNEHYVKYQDTLSEFYEKSICVRDNQFSQSIKNNCNKDLKQIEIDLNEQKNILNNIDSYRFKKTSENVVTNLTTQTYIRSLLIAQKSLFNEFFGWGFDNYDLSYAKYKFIIAAINPKTLTYNTTDASNNFSKIIVEFGIFGILLFIFLFKISVSNYISIEVKCFALPIIITQLIRGAGYFNGGFTISIILLVLIYFSNKHYTTK